MTQTPLQIRGNCQCCGRDQAVVGNSVAKHGYEVKDGYFQGVCQGHRYLPLQSDRAVADRMIADVLADADRQQLRAEDLRAGRVLPVLASTGRFQNGKAVTVPFAEAPEHRRAAAIATAIHVAESRAQFARSWAKDHAELASRIFGTELREVARATAPAPISRDEKKRDEAGRAYAVRTVVGGVVHYERTSRGDDRKWLGKMSTRAWRSMPAAD